MKFQYKIEIAYIRYILSDLKLIYRLQILFSFLIAYLMTVPPSFPTNTNTTSVKQHVDNPGQTPMKDD